MEKIARWDGREQDGARRRGLAVAEAAQKRLQRSPYPSIRNVLCRCDEGVLLLYGTLPTYYHKQVAQESVACLDGVAQVVNDIVVADPPNTCGG